MNKSLTVGTGLLLLMGWQSTAISQSVSDYERAARAKVQARKAAEARAAAEQRAAEAAVIAKKKADQRAAEAAVIAKRKAIEKYEAGYSAQEEKLKKVHESIVSNFIKNIKIYNKCQGFFTLLIGPNLWQFSVKDKFLKDYEVNLSFQLKTTYTPYEQYFHIRGDDAYWSSYISDIRIVSQGGVLLLKGTAGDEGRLGGVLYHPVARGVNQADLYNLERYLGLSENLMNIDTYQTAVYFAPYITDIHNDRKLVPPERVIKTRVQSSASKFTEWMPFKYKYVDSTDQWIGRILFNSSYAATFSDNEYCN